MRGQTHQHPYLPEVDGLRALAVLSVILFHLALAPFPGGYVGVDIFFVISGYLITGIILRQTEEGRFSFFDFYARRFRRIYPALIVTVLVTCVLFGLFSPPSRVQELGGTAVYVLLSISNFYFWQTSSYFDPTSEMNPLLHTWSLGVEEQFYLFWPVVLVLASRLRLVPLFLCTSVVAGLALSELGVRADQTAAFYLTPFRIFQFGTGGLVFWLHWKRPAVPAWAGNILFATGMTLAVVPILIFSSTTAFPGLNAAIPTAGAALIILAREAKPLSLLLGNPAAAYLGRISYALYLTHWPAIVLYKQLVGPELVLADAAVIFLFTLGTAILLHTTVERPARMAEVIRRVRMRPATIVNVLGSAVVLGLAFNFYTSDGWAWRFPSAIIVTQEQLAAERARYWENRPATIIDAERPNIAVIGDSHAIDLFYALHENGVPNVSVLGYPHNCDNVLDAGPEAGQDRDWTAECKRLFAAHLKSDRLASADVILLVERWVSGDHSSLGSALSALRNANPSASVAVIGPKHQFVREPVDILNEQQLGVDVNDLAARYLRDRSDINSEMRRYAQTQNVAYVDMYGIMCPPNHCELAVGGKLTYFDNQHWTDDGARIFGERLVSDASFQNLLSTELAPPRQSASTEIALVPAASPPRQATTVVPSPERQPEIAPPPGASSASTEAAVVWIEPENVAVEDRNSPPGSFEASTTAALGPYRIRYGLQSAPGEPVRVRWPVQFGTNDHFLVYVFNSADAVYGTIQIWTADGVPSLRDHSGDLTDVQVTSGESGWYNIKFTVSTRPGQTTQLLLYPTEGHGAALSEPVRFAFGQPELELLPN